MTKFQADGTKVYLGEDGKWRPYAEHLEHLRKALNVASDTTSPWFDEDYVRRLRGAVAALERADQEEGEC